MASHGGHNHGGGHSHDGGHGHEDGHDCCGSGHGHGGGHGHGHGKGDLEQPFLPQQHSHEGGAFTEDQLKLQRAVYFALFFMMVEIVGGVVAKSLAVITDAAHMLSDVGGFVVSLVALHLSAQAATAEYTYGFKQAEVLGALLSIAIVWALTAVLLWEAVGRFIELQEVDAPIMLAISVIGFVVNIALMKVLGHGHSHGGGDCGHGHSHGGHGEVGSSVAVQAAMAHVIGDIVQSLGVCLAAGLIWWQPIDLGVSANGVSRWNYADPCCTVLFGVLVLLTTKQTLVRTIQTLMSKAPDNVQQGLLTKLSELRGVVQIHDLHVWSMGSSDVLATAHIVVESGDVATSVLKEAVKASKSMGLDHTTFQLEVEGEEHPDGCGASCSPEIMRKQEPSAKSAHAAHGDCCDGHSHEAGHPHGGGHSHGGGGHSH